MKKLSCFAITALSIALITPHIGFASDKDVAQAIQRSEKAQKDLDDLLEKHRSVAFIVGESNFSGVFEKKNSKGVIESQVTYLNGKLNGKAIWWDDFDKGFKKLERTYKDGLIDGIATEWWSGNEKESEISYKLGKKDGLEISYLNGRKHTETNWKDGKQNGLETSYNEDGSKSSETNYKNGKKDGISNTWIISSDNGDNIRVETIYKNGKQIDETWHRKPNVIGRIKNRCQTQMGEHGYALVKACVDQDLAAIDYISDQLDKNKSIANRCIKTMGEHGEALIKACIEQDLSAKEMLDKY